MKYNPYFLFDGQAEEAIKTYTKAFNGESKIMKYKDAPPNPNFQIQEELKEKVMHGEVRIGDLIFMICDSSPMNPVKSGNSVQVSMTFENKEEFQNAFDVLKTNAKIFLEPSETFFAKYYTTFEDSFGVTWQFLLLQAH